MALQEDNKYGPSQMLMEVYTRELAYLTNLIIVNTPDGYTNTRFT
jgi:hypothetical protein